MKKFRIVALLLVMCLASSCFVGGTFAKYSSTDSASDTAIVAKWAITAENQDIATSQWTTFSLFATAADVPASAAVAEGAADDTDVRAAGNIVAPGTAGMFQIDLENLSDVTVKYTLTFAATPANIPGGATLPIEYSLKGAQDADDWTTDITTLNVTDAIINIDGATSDTVYWRWVYGDDATIANDTALGIAAAAGPIPEVMITATLTATQVD